MAKLKYAITILACLFVISCAEPITYYSNTKDQTRQGKIHFIAMDGIYTSISVFKDTCECKGVQNVCFFVQNVDKTIFVPYRKYLTLSIYAQTPGIKSFKHAGVAYSVPFESGEIRVICTPKDDTLFTQIERLDSQLGWLPVQGVVKRTLTQPFLNSGPWCKPITGVE